jgi:phospholipase C
MVYRSIAAAVGLCVASSLVWAADLPHTGHASRRVPKTPIENLIVIVGENQTFDGVFATYIPKPGATVRNLLSEGIVDGDGNPGPRFAQALQRKAVPQAVFMLNPPRAAAYGTLPPPRLIGVQDQNFHDVANGVDRRFPGNLPDGPFQITHYVPYPKENTAPTLESATTALSAATGDPVHRFFQMWQQTGGDNSKPDLYAWVAITTGMGADTDGITAADPGQGGELMGFVNMHRGDASYLRSLADSYAMSDNHHQFISLGFLQKKGVASHCEPGAYYLVNNYGAGYDLDGHTQPLGPKNYTYPPQTVPTIAEALDKAGVSWSWYTGGRDAADVGVEMKKLHLSLDAARRLQYNDIGDPLVASKTVMTQPALKSRLKGLTSFDRDVARGTLPAVSFLVPKNLDSGHPGYSVEATYEDFVRTVITEVQAHPKLWAHTAILVTTDEGGGHFDSGFIQILDFFWDGPRIPMIVVSPFVKRGYIDHSYTDHASISKFIEYNWDLPRLSSRSRDNLANPVASPQDPYKPTNGPAVGDLLTLFSF